VASSPPELSTRPLRPALRAAGLLTFVGLGIPDGLLGVAWPELRRAQHQPASALSILLVCGTGAFFLSTALSARAARRFGNRRLLMSASVAAMLGGVAVAASPTFAVTAAGIALLSGGAGLVDAIISSLASLAGPPQLISWMHSIYAVGAAGAPLVIAASGSPSAWRVVYLSVGCIYCVLLLIWALFAPDGPRPALRHRTRAGVDGRRVALVLATFVAASGLEIAVGAWASEYLADGLEQRSTVASVGALGFWAALCVARLGAGWGGIRLAAVWLVGGSLVAVAGGIALWASSSALVAIIAFVLLGLGAGPMLPMLTVLTPHRVGRQAAAQIIGWQLAAASVGSALFAGGVGLLVHRSGVGVIPPVLATMAVVTAVLIVALDRQTASREAG